MGVVVPRNGTGFTKAGETILLKAEDNGGVFGDRSSGNGERPSGMDGDGGARDVKGQSMRCGSAPAVTVVPPETDGEHPGTDIGCEDIFLVKKVVYPQDQ